MSPAASALPHDPVSARLAEIGHEFDHTFSLELSRIEAALEALGRPQDRLAPVFHVAGTNGKGSVCAFLRAITEGAGRRAHVFTSPHLIRPNERIRIAGKLVSDAQFIAALDKLAATGALVTYFEAITAAALLLFAEMPADAVILETGLGGRVDATNIFPKPAAAIITPIDMDHAHLLGDTLAKIAAEKAGILKSGAPAIIARQKPEAMEVIEARAGAIGAPLERCGVEWDCWVKDGRMLVQTEDRLLDLPLPSLIGPHQIDNAGLAVRAALLMDSLTDDQIGKGIASAQWPARMQLVTQGPLAAQVRAAGGDLWIDGGHNVHAGLALAATLAQLRARAPRPMIAICGMLGTKDCAGFFGAIADQIDGVVTAPIASSRAALDPRDLAAIANAQGLRAVAAHSLPEAVALALKQAEAPRAVICGSLYLAGEALALSGIELS
ncbi:MAG TPA: folylpolyglutamate synthase/dihydrofolate synthase family protein [Caulobacterales bacterium]|nr:folylpolyglutamate synthase/dihydrofolate synthase family protein [Caulobacterales bacterium]